ncbi:hypothetical protein [Neomoorella thermoacetica]|uniref:hypothetical protein n=1 Tax=Neomoorella thermoacetica TaxID=1525 RepID=UPI0008FB4267|nr:hypothetical protein [Moorella thermoacetica]APC07879.1 hypothetical protein MTJW_07090 [Moorella thermoacetica]
MDFPWKLFREALETGEEYLPRLREGIRKTGLLFQEGKEGEAVYMFNQLLDGFEWLASVVGGFDLALKEGLIAAPPGNKIEGAVKSFGARLQELQDAWENTDYVFIGDLLTYEFVPMVEEWENIVITTGRSLPAFI